MYASLDVALARAHWEKARSIMGTSSVLFLALTILMFFAMVLMIVFACAEYHDKHLPPSYASEKKKKLNIPLLTGSGNNYKEKKKRGADITYLPSYTPGYFVPPPPPTNEGSA